MSLFRRRNQALEEGVEPGQVEETAQVEEAGATVDGATVEETSSRAGSGDFDRSSGPWDATEVEEEGAPEPGQAPLIDLGALRFRAQEGLELSLEVDESQSRVTSVTVKMGASAVQLQAFAAPRTSGIWDEIREGIATSVTGQGGSVDEMPGVFGRELLARVPVRGADGKPTRQAVRFTGVDGPRWFLRAVFHGEAAYKPESAVPLENLVRSVVVARGGEAMAPRDLLPLRMPTVPGNEPDAEGTPEPEETPREALRPFERGPEITEVR